MINRLLTDNEIIRDMTARNYTDAEIEELIYDLQGTCQSLEEAVQKTDHKKELTVADCQVLDQNIFCCEQCNWWDEASQESVREPGCCVDCEPEDDND